MDSLIVYLMIYGLSYIFEGKFMKNFFFRHKPSTSLIWIQLIKIFFLFGLIDLMKIQIYIVFVFTKVIKGSQFLSGYIYSLWLCFPPVFANLTTIQKEIEKYDNYAIIQKVVLSLFFIPSTNSFYSVEKKSIF